MDGAPTSTRAPQLERSASGTARTGYEDVRGFCQSVPLSVVKEADYALTPGRYVGMVELPANDSGYLEGRISELTRGLVEQFREGQELQALVRVQLARLVS